MKDITLFTHSVFESISGEVGVNIPQGMWCTFIRLQGCNLRCNYCDTKITQACGGIMMSIDAIIEKVTNKHVIITGGEPLLQKQNFEILLNALIEKGHVVQVETNGSYPIPENNQVGWVVDYKGPSSGMDAKMLSSDIFAYTLKKGNAVIKFVLANDQDLYFAASMIGKLNEAGYNGNFAFSPVHGNPSEVKKTIETLRFFLDQKLLDRIIISLQIHKICNLA